MLSRRAGADGIHPDPGRPRRPDGEAGNVVLTTVVLMVVTLLTIAMFVGARRSVIQGRLDTAAGRAEAGAELAVNEAFARIDAGLTERFVGSGTVAETAYSYTAEPVSASTWVVRGEAASGAIARATEATVSRAERSPYTVFIVNEFLSANNRGTVAGRVGTNGTIEVFGRPPGAVQELYRPDGNCRRCRDAVVLDGPREVPPVVTPTSGFTPCPADGRFVGTVDGGAGTPYRCDDPGVPVRFEGEVVVANPPLVVHVGREVPLQLDGAVVNQSGPASDFRLFVAGEPGDGVAGLTAEGASVRGVLYGPGRSLITTESDWTGSLTLYRLEVTRAGELSVAEDTSIGSGGDTGWRVVSYRSVPSSR